MSRLLKGLSTFLVDKAFLLVFFFFQAEDGIRDYKVTGVQTCALPISQGRPRHGRLGRLSRRQVRGLRPRRERHAAAPGRGDSGPDRGAVRRRGAGGDRKSVV